MSAPLLAAAPTGDTATIAPAISSAILDDAAGALPPPTAENAVPEWFAKAKATLMKSPEWPALKANVIARLQRAALLLDETKLLETTTLVTDGNAALNNPMLQLGLSMFPGKVGGVAHKELVVKPGTTASGGGRGAGASPSRGPEVDRRSVYSADTSSTSAAKKKLPKRRQLTELTKEELLDLLEQVEVDMSHDELYVRLHRQCVEVAEQKVYDNAVKVARSNRSPDTILEGADIASAAYDLVNYRTFRELFRHWPDMRRTFVRLVNVPLTTELRKVVWFACLQDPRTAHDYEKFLTTARLEKMTRVHGGKFYAQSQQILSLSDDWEYIRTTPPLMLCLKHVVLYLYEQQNALQVKELLRTIIHIVIPFIHVYQADIKLRDIRDITNGVSTLIAQMATSLLRMFQSCIYGGVVLRDQMFVVFDGLLREKNPELHDALFKLNSGEQTTSCLATMMDLLMRFAFVDIVPIETTIYLWDQLIIGSRESSNHSFLPQLPLVMCWLFTIHACLLQEAYQSCKSDNEIEAITMSHSRFIIGDDYSKDLTSFYAPFLESLAPSVEEKRPSLDQLEHWKGPEEKAEAELAEKQQRPSGPDVDVSGFDKGNIMRSLSPVLADRTLPPVSIDPRHTLTGDNAPAGLQLPDMTGTTLNNIQETLDEPRTETRAFDPSHKPQSIMDLTPTLLWKIDAVFGSDILRKELQQKRRQEAEHRAAIFAEDVLAVERQEYGKPLSETERAGMLPTMRAEFMKKLESFRRKKNRA